MVTALLEVSLKPIEGSKVQVNRSLRASYQYQPSQRVWLKDNIFSNVELLLLFDQYFLEINIRGIWPPCMLTFGSPNSVFPSTLAATDKLIFPENCFTS